MKILIQAVQKESLVEVVKAQRAAFDHYRGVEQGDFSEDERLRNHIHRISRYQFGPGSRCVKACDTATGELLGAAVWVLPGVTQVPMIIDPIGATGGNRELEEDVVACESLDVEKWNENWAADDHTRNAVMKGEEHFFLAPIFTVAKHQRKGVASALINRQKTDHPLVPIVLLVRKTKIWAKALYEKLGFQKQGESENGELDVMVWRPGT